MSIDDSSVKLTRNREPNNLLLHLSKDRHLQKKWITASSFSADSHPQQMSLNGSRILSACLPITQWPVSMATVVEMMSRSSPSNWFVRLLSIKGQVRLTVEQDSSLTQHRLPMRKNFRSIDNLNEASGIPNSIEDDSGRKGTSSGEL